MMYWVLEKPLKINEEWRAEFWWGKKPEFSEKTLASGCKSATEIQPMCNLKGTFDDHLVSLASQDAMGTGIPYS